MPDFSLAAVPNFAQAALGGYKAGQAQGQQDRLDSALQGIDLERPETLLPVLRADPSTGAALIGASTKLAAEKRDAASRQAVAAYIKSIQPSGGQAAPVAASAPSQAPVGAGVTQPTAADPGAAASADPSADVVITAQRQPAAPPADPNAIRNAAIDADPTGFMDIQSKIGAMDKAQRERLSDASDTFASIGQTALTLPYEQRKAYIQAHGDVLLAHGVPAAKIAAFDPTDQNIHTEVGTALGVKGQIDQLDKDRTFSNTVRHQGVEESQGAARLGLEGANVGIARGHLAIAQRADARAATTAAAKTTGGAAPVRYEYRTVNGVVQKRAIP